jgi:2,5-diketo-D-gluconate reductase B
MPKPIVTDTHMHRRITTPQQSTRLSVPVAGLGTLKLSQSALVAGLQNGFRCVDSAKAYQNEAMIRAAIAESGVPPNEVTVITKLFNHNVVSRQTFRDALTDSTVQLGKIPEVVLFHGPYPTMPLVALILELEQLQSVGAVKAWGVSNFSREHLEFLASLGYEPALNQVEYHPYFQRPDLRDYCQEHGIVLQAYRPLAEGTVLADPILLELGRKYQVNPAQVVYAWLAQQGLAIVTKVSSEAHQREYLESAKLTLSDDDMGAIAQLNKGEPGRTCKKGGWLESFTDVVRAQWRSSEAPL